MTNAKIICYLIRRRTWVTMTKNYGIRNKWHRFNIQKWKKYKARRHWNLWPPPLQPKPHGAQGRLRVRFVAYGNTINLIEGIFEFRSQSREIQPLRGGARHPPRLENAEKFFFQFFSFFTWIVFVGVLTNVNKRFHRSFIHFSPKKYPVFWISQNLGKLAEILRTICTHPLLTSLFRF